MINAAIIQCGMLFASDPMCGREAVLACVDASNPVEQSIIRSATDFMVELIHVTDDRATVFYTVDGHQTTAACHIDTLLEIE